MNTFLVDGHVAGSWSLERGRVALRPFGQLRREDRRALQEEGARLETFLGGRATREGDRGDLSRKMKGTAGGRGG